MQAAADFNPVNWAIEAGREAVSAGTDWGFVASRAGFLAGAGDPVRRLRDARVPRLPEVRLGH